jgi:hypothetical protein
MTIKGIDIAWARPDTDGIKATGAKWVARYFSNDKTKDLTAAEVKAYPAAGLAIVVVRETTANRAGQGRQAGIDDAKAALAEAKAVGLPTNVPIYFAVDYDATPAAVKPYFDGITSVIPKNLVGCYGGYRIIEWANSYGLIYLWQAEAWSNGAWSKWTDIRQEGGTTLSGGADYDDAMSPDFGQFPRPITPEKNVPLNAADEKLVETAVKNVLTSQEVRDLLGAVAAYWVGLAVSGTVKNGMTDFEKSMVPQVHAQFQAALKAAK